MDILILNVCINAIQISYIISLNSPKFLPPKVLTVWYYNITYYAWHPVSVYYIHTYPEVREGEDLHIRKNTNPHLLG